MNAMNFNEIITTLSQVAKPPNSPIIQEDRGVNDSGKRIDANRLKKLERI